MPRDAVAAIAEPSRNQAQVLAAVKSAVEQASAAGAKRAVVLPVSAVVSWVTPPNRGSAHGGTGGLVHSLDGNVPKPNAFAD